MEPLPNTPETWDDLWADISPAALQEVLNAERLSIRWQRIRGLVKAEMSGLAELKTVEIGAGTGTYSLLMAEEGSEVTIIDYSEKALEASRRIFALHGIKASWMQHDVLSLPNALNGRFDIAMSFGTAEHFRGAERIMIVQAHYDLIRPGGLAIVSVPNAWNLPYRIYKFNLEMKRRWAVGEEYPFTRRELRDICRRNEWRNFRFIADSAVSSFRFLRFLSPLRKMRFVLRLPEKTDKGRFRQERGTFLDEYLAYGLTLCVKKH